MGSLLPSLARSRFSSYQVLDPICRDYAVALSTDIYNNIENPKYLKFLLEKLISLNYHKATNKSQESLLNGQIFFEQVLEMITLKKGSLESDDYKINKFEAKMEVLGT